MGKNFNYTAKTLYRFLGMSVQEIVAEVTICTCVHFFPIKNVVLKTTLFFPCKNTFIRVNTAALVTAPKEVFSLGSFSE